LKQLLCFTRCDIAIVQSGKITLLSNDLIPCFSDYKWIIFSHPSYTWSEISLAISPLIIESIRASCIGPGTRLMVSNEFINLIPEFIDKEIPISEGSDIKWHIGGIHHIQILDPTHPWFKDVTLKINNYCEVYTSQVDGNYISYPRWNHTVPELKYGKFLALHGAADSKVNEGAPNDLAGYKFMAEWKLGNGTVACLGSQFFHIKYATKNMLRIICNVINQA